MKPVKISIDGASYLVDLNKAIKDGYLKPELPPEKHASGDHYRDKSESFKDNAYYVLAVVGLDRRGVKMALIEVGEGYRFATDAVRVKDARSLTKAEWDAVTANEPSRFVPVKLQICER